MQINQIETFVLKVPAETPYLGEVPNCSAGQYFLRPPWQSLYAARYETMLVRIVAEDGTEGWGEALAPVGPEIVAAVINYLLAPALVGRDAATPRANWKFLRSLMRERGHLVGHQADALAALDIALWDLCGQITGRRIVDLLGGALREEIPVYVSGLPNEETEARADLARTFAQQGAERFKLHLGRGIAQDLEIFDSVQAAVPDAYIAVDAHWAYTLADAAALCGALEERGAWFVEAPMAPEDLAGHADLATRTRLPIAVGEALRNRYEFAAWLDVRALSIAQPDVARTGITELMVISDLCSVRGVSVAPHHSTGMGVSLAAGLQLSGAIESLTAFEYQPTSVALSELRLGTHIEHDADSFKLPSGHGLGLEIDLETVRALQRES